MTLLSVGDLFLGLLEPRQGEYDFGWLDEVLDNLAGAGIKVALATATAAPPAWLVRKHPEILPVTAEGTVLERGSRRHYSPSSAVYRRYAAAITRKLAERYKDHPALALWHVDNELGCHVSEFYGPEDAAAFRRWLERRYGSIEALNEAWGTAFWSQHYGSFEEIIPPRRRPHHAQPDAAAGLPAVQFLGADGLLPEPAGGDPGGHPRRSRHHQPHGFQRHQVHGLLRLGEGSGRGGQRPLPGGRGPGAADRTGVQRGPHSRNRRQ